MYKDQSSYMSSCACFHLSMQHIHYFRHHLFRDCSILVYYCYRRNIYKSEDAELNLQVTDSDLLWQTTSKYLQGSSYSSSQAFHHSPCSARFTFKSIKSQMNSQQINIITTPQPLRICSIPVYYYYGLNICKVKMLEPWLNVKVFTFNGRH